MKSARFFLPALIIFGAVLLCQPARAEVQLQAYGGANWNFDSEVKLNKGAVSDTRDVSWEGKSFETPPYWGVRGIYWLEDYQPGFGIALDFTHAKAYGDINFNADGVYNHLEFTDGINLLITTAMYRFAGFFDDALAPYIGAGVGVAIPHVEVRLDAFPAQETLEYQVTGVATQMLAGMEWRFYENWAAFVEGKISYANIDADLNGGGTVETEIWSPQVAIGISYRFGL